MNKQLKALVHLGYGSCDGDWWWEVRRKSLGDGDGADALFSDLEDCLWAIPESRPFLVLKLIEMLKNIIERATGDSNVHIQDSVIESTHALYEWLIANSLVKGVAEQG
jgi:hypothetical protein